MPVPPSEPQSAHTVMVALKTLLLSPGSNFSLLSLACAGIVAGLFLIWRRRKARRPAPRLRVLAKALLTPKPWLGPSGQADMILFLLNILATGALIGWGLWSAGTIATACAHFLEQIFGARGAPALPPWAGGIALTLMLFLAYDFSYWVDHWLKHKVPLLWAFHRTHHTAEALTPLTAYRMHPLDSLVFSNIVALGVGLAAGAGRYFLGPVQPFLLDGTNILLVLFLCATIHLQHSHVPIAVTGWAGKVIFSPAHHHIHHSTSPAHFGANLGSCLALWDWLFGTLIAPESVRGKLVFGVAAEGDRYSHHSIAGTLAEPFLFVARMMSRAIALKEKVLTARPDSSAPRA